jgi:hypothetical protein
VASLRVPMIRTRGNIIGKLVLFTVFVTLAFSNQDCRAADVWRTLSNGGINVLYCYMRISGAAVTYEALKQHVDKLGSQPESVSTLIAVAEKHGVHLRPMEMRLTDLARADLPVIVHVDGETPETGAFLLVLDITPLKLDFINGPSATIGSISRDEFQRVWSGVALVPKRSQIGNLAVCIVGVIIGLCVASLISTKSQVVFSRLKT